jgi:hypothetical protein
MISKNKSLSLIKHKTKKMEVQTHTISFARLKRLACTCWFYEYKMVGENWQYILLTKPLKLDKDEQLQRRQSL